MTPSKTRSPEKSRSKGTTPAKKGRKNAKALLPRTAADAKRRGYKAKKIPDHKLPHNQKENWLVSEAQGKGAICGVRPLPGGGVEICYIDPQTGECNDCYRSGG
jgi:hypothetical protein